MDFPLPVGPAALYSILLSPIGVLDLENVGVVAEVLFLSYLQAEIQVVLVWRPPSWIFHFWFGCTIFPLEY